MKEPIYVVATMNDNGASMQRGLLYGDIILVTTDEKQARNVKYIVEERKPYPGLDYDKLLPFTHCIYFSRIKGEVIRHD